MPADALLKIVHRSEIMNFRSSFKGREVILWD